MKKIVFLLEEPSMKVFVEGYLPRVMPGIDFICIKHEGKQDLEKSIPRKLRAFHDSLFVVVRDNDGADCHAIKARLKSICESAGNPGALIRLACQELEAWHLGAPSVLAEIYGRPKLAELGRKAKYRDPDHLGSPSSELARLVPEFRKIDCARRMGQAMPVEETKNRSRSFQVFVEGIRRITSSAVEKKTHRIVK
jgi:hypothetical protein